MSFEGFSFGAIRIDGVTYRHDVIIDRGQIRKRKKKPSKKFRDAFGHTPLSINEIPRKCRRSCGGRSLQSLPTAFGIDANSFRGLANSNTSAYSSWLMDTRPAQRSRPASSDQLLPGQLTERLSVTVVTTSGNFSRSIAYQ